VSGDRDRSSTLRDSAPSPSTSSRRSDRTQVPAAAAGALRRAAHGL